MRILLTLLVTIVVVMGFGVSFKDVPVNHWAYDAVNEISELGIISGYPDGTFRGVDFVNRYQLAVAIYRTIEYIKSQMKNYSSPSQSGPQPQVISSIKSSLSDLEEKYKMLANYVDNKYKSVYGSLSSLEKEIRENSLEISKVKESVSRNEDSLEYIDGRLTKFATALVGVSKRVDENTKSVKSLMDSINKLEKAYSIFTDYVNDVKESLRIVKETLDSSLSDLNSKVKDLKIDLGDLSATVVSVREKVDENSSNVEKIRVEVKGISKAIAVIEKSVAENRSSLQDLKEDLGKVKNKEMEDYRNLSEGLKDVKSRLVNLEKSVSDLNDGLTNVVEPELAKTKASILKLEKRISSLEEVSGTFVKKEDYQKNLDDLNARFEVMDKEIKRLSSTNSTQWIIMLLMTVGIGAILYMQVSGGVG